MSEGEKIHSTIVRAIRNTREVLVTEAEADALASNIIMLLAANGYAIK